MLKNIATGSEASEAGEHAAPNGKKEKKDQALQVLAADPFISEEFITKERMMFKLFLFIECKNETMTVEALKAHADATAAAETLEASRCIALQVQLASFDQAKGLGQDAARAAGIAAEAHAALVAALATFMKGTGGPVQLTNDEGFDLDKDGEDASADDAGVIVATFSGALVNRFGELVADPNAAQPRPTNQLTPAPPSPKAPAPAPPKAPV
ncbi:hypothetical protein M885DRAFT_619402 [Pelagophyceae sp. CCMP2097]|nr:hypothetical protein M885DRAFT_619402 [Pelagophyceae sp. CCMP2097]